MSVFSDLATGMLTQLQALTGALTGDSANGIEAIDTTHVVLRNMQYDATLWQQWRSELSPGWVIGLDQEVMTDPQEGTDHRDDAVYGFWLCGLDRDDDHFDANRMAVWMSRRQAVVRYFHMNNLQGLVADGIRTTLCWTPGQSMYNEQVRKLYHIVNVMIPVKVKVREPRDATGAG